MRTGSQTRLLLIAALVVSLLLPLIAGCSQKSTQQDEAKVEKLKQDKLKSDK